MANENWEQVKDIFDAALRQKPEERPRFLNKVCPENETLRREVESLLSSFDHANSFMEKPVIGEMAEAETIKRSVFATGHCLGHYEIIEQIGAGGMGEVYLAKDTKLRRKVAIKLLNKVSDKNEEYLRRFFQEAHSASALNHPNILTIHEIGESDGTHFIAAEYIKGKTLRQRFGGEEPLPISESIEITLQIASALCAAHEAGIVHRDIKPENIMLREDGLLKVLDFGLAKLTKSEPPALADALDEAATFTQVQTNPGIILGTVAYMSPEQARGKAVDARTDIFSFGIVLYEMLTGKLPFAGETASDVIAAILKNEPAPLAEYLSDIPKDLERIVNKTLSKNREERYQHIKDLLIDLKDLKHDLELEATLERTAEPSKKDAVVVGTKIQKVDTISNAEYIVNEIKQHKSASIFLLTILLLAVSGSSFLYFLYSSVGVKQINSIAVLPLENISGDPAQDYFADGMTEELINNLAQIRAFSRVISRTSVMRYKGSGKSLREIAQELNVDAVIEGTVQRSGSRVRVTARLIPAATDSPLWARDYERDISDVLKLQSEMARAVAAEIRVQVTPEELARLAVAHKINPQAHEAYLLGRHHLRTNENDLRQAIGHFERAIQLGPEFAPAYAGLSQAWDLRGLWGVKNLNEVIPLARDAALKALVLDSQLAEAHIVLSTVKTYEWEWAAAEQELTRALDLDPNSARAHQQYADLLMMLERHDEAIREIERAEQLDPLSSYIQSRFARILYRARKYDEALPHVQRAFDLDPNPGNAMPFWIQADLYLELGRYDEAIAAFKQYQSQSGQIPSTLGSNAGVARALALMGKREEARRILEELKATDSAGFSNTAVAHAYAALGDTDQAFKVLFRLVEERNSLATTIKADPPLDSLHSDPRWNEVLRRMNLPPE